MVRLLTAKHVYNSRTVIYPDLSKKKKKKKKYIYIYIYSLLESEENNVKRGC